MGSKKKTDRGELLLLGVFALFVIVYLLDIHTLPMEGKMLSYVLAPFIFGLLLLCILHALTPAGKRKPAGSRDLEPSSVPSGEAGEGAARAEKGEANKRFLMTLGGGLFLFFAIYLLGFYWGSGLMLLVWFISFRRVDLKTMGVTFLTPLLLYLSFEVLLDMGLPQGVLLKWFGF